MLVNGGAEYSRNGWHFEARRQTVTLPLQLPRSRAAPLLTPG